MTITSENIKIYVEKVIISSFGNKLRAAFITSLFSAISFFAGMVVIAANVDPRVAAVEEDIQQLRLDFLEAYKQKTEKDKEFQDELILLQAKGLETSVQVQMLILYGIPTAEREALKQEAEKLVEVQELGQ